MQANTVVLSLERYHELLEKEEMLNKLEQDGLSIVVNNNHYCYEKYTYLTNDEIKQEVQEKLDKLNKRNDELNSKKSELTNSNHNLHIQIVEVENELNEVSKKSIWGFLKWAGEYQKRKNKD